ncbi:TfuA-like protein [Actinoplanes sp. NPDC049668]|uniref:TfuA-like protein n=1 Tax=unclassified Actinoplanes TaxID=2626549 RepID=UPI0033B434F7
MNRMVVYAGPTLSAERIREIVPDAEIQPPVEGGMLERDHLGAGDVAVIIDGCYRDRPAVRHKEILHVMDLGVTVIGAASMGAMRAAELDRHGMIGVGRVYRMYRDGEINGDDEVAVRHGPAIRGYRADSIALVNLRHGCGLAVQQGRVSAATAEALVAGARDLVFDERTPPRLASALPGDERAGILALLDELRASDLKAQDAAEALELAVRLRAGPTSRPNPAAGSPPWRTSYLRDWITYWDDVTLGESGDWVSAVDVLEAARLYDPGYPEVHRQILIEMLTEAAGDATLEAYAMGLLGVRPGATTMPERLTRFLSGAEQRQPVGAQALEVVLRVWPANICRDWRPAVLERLREHPSWSAWRDLVHEADAARNGDGVQAREDLAGLLFLHRWGVSGPAARRELGRRGFLTFRGLDRVAARFGTLELRRRAAART